MAQHKAPYWRNRSEDHTTPLVAVPEYGELCNGSSYETAPETYHAQTGFLRSMDDLVTPGFRKLSQEGKFVVSPMRSEVQTFGYSPTYWHAERVSNCSGSAKRVYRGSGTIYGDPSYFLMPWQRDTKKGQAAYDQAVTLAGTKAWAGVADSEAMLTVDWLEREQTIKALKEPVSFLATKLKRLAKDKRLQRQIRAQWKAAPKALKRQWDANYRAFVKSGSKPDAKWIGKWPSLATVFDAAKSSVGTASNRYLQYRYMVIPTMLTVEAGLKALEASRVQTRFTSRAKEKLQFPTSHASEPCFTGYFWQVSLDSTCELTITARAGIVYEYSTSFASDMGLRISDIPVAALDMLRFSFVLNWFVNSEEFLKAVTPKGGVKVLAKFTRVEVEEVCQGSTVCSWKGPSNHTEIHNPSGATLFSRRLTKTRIPDARIGVASKLPTILFEKSKDWYHLADALALVSQVLLKRL